MLLSIKDGLLVLEVKKLIKMTLEVTNISDNEDHLITLRYQ